MVFKECDELDNIIERVSIVGVVFWNYYVCCCEYYCNEILVI